MKTTARYAGGSALFLAAALFYAPLAYGCTRPVTLPALFGLLGAGVLLGLIGYLLDRREPAIPRLVLLSFFAIMLQGWWMVWNPVVQPTGIVDPAQAAASVINIHHLTFHAMLATTFLLGGFLVLCDLLTFPAWRRFLVLALATAGGLICLIGDFLKLTGTMFMHYIWAPREIYWNDFAFYAYHGNAGAFLVLVWPVILVFARRGYSREVNRTRTFFWTVAAIACGAALLLNASKAALIIGLLILPWPFLTVLQRMRPSTLAVLSLGATALLAAGLMTTAKLSDNAAFARLTDSSEVAASFNGRWAADLEYWYALPDAGWFGLGPGLFPVAFPYQDSPLGNQNVGLRENAYQDYFQTILEWGWFGSIWWFLLVAGGLWRAAQTYLQREYFSSKTDRHLVLAAMLGVCGTLAQALIDFPLQVASIRLFFLVLLAFCWASPSLLTPSGSDPAEA